MHLHLNLLSTFNFFTFHFSLVCASHKRQALSRSYGCFFAEFLEKHSLVRLSLLDSTTCVGLRYGFFFVMLRSFSWKTALFHPARRTPRFMLYLDLGLNPRLPDLPKSHPYKTNANPIMR